MSDLDKLINTLKKGKFEGEEAAPKFERNVRENL